MITQARYVRAPDWPTPVRYAVAVAAALAAAAIRGALSALWGDDPVPAFHGPSLRGLRVLVVDDDPDALDLIATILKRAEAEPMLCSSSPEALAALRSWKPDVLVSDIEMPGEDGYSLIRKVRELAGADGGQIPAVALTAYGRPEDRVRSLTAGYSMHVAKPVDPVELGVIVANLAGRSPSG